MERVYAYIRILSLDVVAGALFSTLAIAKLLKVDLGLSTLVCLCMAVWVIYTFDHLIDARNTGHKAHTPRHRFHQKYFNYLAITVAVLSLIGTVLMFYLPPSTLVSGIVVCLFTLLYFFTLRLLSFSPAYQKELFIALVYVFGIFTAPFSLSVESPWPYLIILFGEYLLLALINLIIFARYERETDRADGHLSIVLKLGLEESDMYIRSFAIVTFVLILSGLYFYEGSAFWQGYQGVILGMLILLVLIYMLPGFFRKNERYRTVGDGVFMLPGLLLLV